MTLDAKAEMCISTASPARIEAALRAVLELHRPDPWGECTECDRLSATEHTQHPCRTARTAYAVLEGLTP